MFTSDNPQIEDENFISVLICWKFRQIRYMHEDFLQDLQAFCYVCGLPNFPMTKMSCLGAQPQSPGGRGGHVSRASLQADPYGQFRNFFRFLVMPS